VTHIVLTRYGSTPYGTFGEVKVDDSVFYTVERPWLDNEPYESCIPEGCYEMLWLKTTTPVPSEFEGNTWYLKGDSVGVFANENKQRSRVANHIANTDKDVRGCIGWGKSLSYIESRWGVASSHTAMKELLAILGPENHSISILSSKMG
jgi:hypothetical protein